MNVMGAIPSIEEKKTMIMAYELEVGNIYRHQNKTYVRLESIGEDTVTVEQFGEHRVLDKEYFTKFYTPIHVIPTEDS